MSTVSYSTTWNLNSQHEVVMSYDGHVIGHREGDTFVKPVLGSKHQLRHPPGWAVDADAFDQQVKTGAILFRVEDKESGTTYQVSTDYFERHKGEFDRGFGRQYFLPLGQWEVKRNDNGDRQLAFDFAGG